MERFLMNSQEIGPLDAEEDKIVRFDFSKESAAAATLNTALVEVSMKYGADSTPDQLLVGLAVIVGKDVVQQVRGAGRTVNATYHLRCRVTDSDGYTHVLAADLPVKRL
jgi:hypothetical protein